MALGYFDDYDKKYPEIVYQILEYFDIHNNSPTEVKDKSVLDFCNMFKGEKGTLPVVQKH